MKDLNNELFSSMALTKRESLAIKGGVRSTRITTNLDTGRVKNDGWYEDRPDA